jgi:hypothetical protein
MRVFIDEGNRWTEVFVPDAPDGHPAKVQGRAKSTEPDRFYFLTALNRRASPTQSAERQAVPAGKRHRLGWHDSLGLLCPGQ